MSDDPIDDEDEPVVPPPDSFRLRVLKAVTAALKEITPSNGFVSNLSDIEVAENGETVTKARVCRGRDEFGFNDPRPLVSVLEHPRAIEQLLGTDEDTSAAGEWELLIQGFVTDDRENPTDPAHRLSADVVKRLVREKKRRDPATGSPNLFGLGFREPCVTDLRVGSPVCRPPDGQVSDVAFFYLTLTLTLVEDQEDPFA